MLESIVTGLVLAAVSGLAFLAYKHHDGYMQVSKLLTRLTWSAFLLMAGYWMGYSVGQTSVEYPDIPHLEPSGLFIFVGFFSVQIILGIFDHLPDIIGSDSAGKDEKPDDD